jgi:hypothetical protein
LADELAAGTIDRVMAKSDLELGIEARPVLTRGPWRTFPVHHTQSPVPSPTNR